MTDARGLHKTTIVIWSRYPGDKLELVDLAQQATDGDAYCSKQESVFCDDPFGDPDAPAQEFFVDVLEWEEYLDTVIMLAGPLELNRSEAFAVANDLMVDDRNRYAADLTVEEVVGCVEQLGVRSSDECAKAVAAG